MGFIKAANPQQQKKKIFMHEYIYIYPFFPSSLAFEDALNGIPLHTTRVAHTPLSERPEAQLKKVVWLRAADGTQNGHLASPPPPRAVKRRKKMNGSCVVLPLKQVFKRILTDHPPYVAPQQAHFQWHPHQGQHPPPPPPLR